MGQSSGTELEDGNKKNYADDDIPRPPKKKVPLHELLVFGYCREIQLSLSTKYIPSIISKICFKYLDFCINMKKDLIIFMNLTSSSSLNTNIPCGIFMHDRYTKQTLEIQCMNRGVVQGWDLGEKSLCFIQNIKLPSNITQQIKPKYKQYAYNANNTYSMLFVVGSNAFDIGALVFDNRELIPETDDKKHEIVGYYCRVQPAAALNQILSVLSSNIHDLVVIDGYTYNEFIKPRSRSVIHTFNLNDFEENKWHSSKSVTLQIKRHRRTSSVMIDDNRVIITGGHSDGIRKIEMVNLENKTTKIITNSKYERNEHGIMYNTETNKMYLCGGQIVDEFNVCKHCECYDVVKNKWINLPNLQYQHAYFPILWNEMDNPNILNIASVSTNITEYIDLRKYNKSWSEHKSNFHTQIFDKSVFNIPTKHEHMFHDYRTYVRLLSVCK